MKGVDLQMSPATYRYPGIMGLFPGPPEKGGLELGPTRNQTRPEPEFKFSAKRSLDTVFRILYPKQAPGLTPHFLQVCSNIFSSERNFLISLWKIAPQSVSITCQIIFFIALPNNYIGSDLTSVHFLPPTCFLASEYKFYKSRDSVGGGVYLCITG